MFFKQGAVQLTGVFISVNSVLNLLGFYPSENNQETITRHRVSTLLVCENARLASSVRDSSLWSHTTHTHTHTHRSAGCHDAAVTEKRNMAIYSHRPWARDRKHVPGEASVCTSARPVRHITLFFPPYLFQFSYSHTCLHWAGLTPDVIWIYLASSLQLSAAWDGMFCSASSLKLFDWGQKELWDKANRKGIFNALAFPSILLFPPHLS